MTDNLSLLAELARVKVLFQARAIATVIAGEIIPQPLNHGGDDHANRDRFAPVSILPFHSQTNSAGRR